MLGRSATVATHRVVCQGASGAGVSLAEDAIDVMSLSRAVELDSDMGPLVDRDANPTEPD